MDRKDSVVPEEEEDEERPQLPNGIPGESTDFNLYVSVKQHVNNCILKIPTHVDRDCGSLHVFNIIIFFTWNMYLGTLAVLL